MDGQVTAGTLICAIPKRSIGDWLMKRLAELGQRLAEVTGRLLKPGMRPQDTHEFEHSAEVLVRELARSFEQWCFNSLEPQKVEVMPQQVEHLGQNYRRLKDKSRHASVLTRFGNITLTRVTYRRGSRGRTIAPLEIIPGWRSIAGMEQQHGIDPASKEDVETAKRYLHRYRRFMNYSDYRSHGSPIGSGIVESACKRIVTERLKLSGMRWSHAGAQQIMTLRSILLSQT